MRSFYYRPGKNAVLALFFGVLAFVFGQLAWNSGGFIIWAMAALFATAAVVSALNALNNEPVLKFDGGHLWVRNPLGGVTQVAWREVMHVTLEVMTMRYFGLISVGRTDFVVLSCAGGALGTRRLRFATGNMELPAGGSAGLVQLLQQAHREAAGEVAVGMPPAERFDPRPVAGREPEPVPSSGFDPDAAVARYLAAKQAAERAAPQPPELGQPALRPRPVFGRRTAS